MSAPSELTVCSSSVNAEPGCITCGDVAVVLTVVELCGADATCRDDEGRTELVATELVGTVAVGDRVLVHAGVAIGPAPAPGGAGG
ncbi:MAG TPA: HypC/HybG/HupF family hydrogenase formation chaperone [Sporichthya sp.]|nr:HypC/HybG/HupF family hydrogenase formation chaperone [Sporichthya sp.]